MLPAHAKRLALVMGNDNYTSITNSNPVEAKVVCFMKI